MTSSLGREVRAARGGDVAAFSALVEATHAMAYAVAWRILRNEADARDAVQDAYLSAYRRLHELADTDAFAGWLRRIVITRSLNRRRGRRRTWVVLDEAVAPPVLDDAERSWTDAQGRALARALLSLGDDERRLCELHYHGGMTADRLAAAAGVDPAAMRKRLQRLRDKLRREIEMDEQRILGDRKLPDDMPARIVELLARPRLVNLPENPVGETLAVLQAAFPQFRRAELPEQLDIAAAERQLGGDAVYIDRSTLQTIADTRVLRYDLTLPLLLSVRWEGEPLRLTAAGKVYRRETESATHLEAFHQLELFAMDEIGTLEPWWLAGRILDGIDRVLPRTEVRMTPTDYPMCARAWSLDVRRDDAWVEVMAWGVYADWVVRGVGGDPQRQIALGAGFGLERLASLRHDVDDIRKLASARVA